MNTLQILAATEKRLSNAIAEIVVLREKLAAKGAVIEAARKVIEKHKPDEGGCVHWGPEGNPTNGIPVYFVDDDAERDLEIFHLEAALAKLDGQS